MRNILCVFVLLLCQVLSAQDLSLSLSDLRLETRSDGAYHLFIRYKPDISSVLLTETTRDPQYRADNYAYRTAERNPVNGKEIRLINGFPIPQESNIYSLISSTPERHPDLGWAYHIYIPETLYYGYEDGRNGVVKVGDGTYLNIRTFHYAYADYRGAFKDNPFVLQLPAVIRQENTKPPAGEPIHNPAAVKTFIEIASENNTFLSTGSDFIEQLKNIINKEKSGKLELALCLDTTGSMRPYVDDLRKELPEIFKELTAGSGNYRIGIVLFKDYYEEYITKVIPFTSGISALEKSLEAIRVGGGGDIPEAVHEALHAGATQLKWSDDSSKVMILVGDAPPHSVPRGKITKKMVDKEIQTRGIKTYAIVLPKG